MRIKPNYFIIPLITVAVAIFGSYFTSQGVNGWYDGLIKPEWTPVGSFIGAMWTFLYILVTLIVISFWNNFKESKKFNLIVGLFLTNAILNATWSMLFFGFNLLGFSLIHITLLNLTIILLMILLWPKSKKLSLCMLPYFGWVSIATALNYFIWIYN